MSTKTSKAKTTKTAPARQQPTTDYDELAQWAENDMTLTPNSHTALRGDDAAAAGRALLERVTGRPRLDPTDNSQDGPSPRRQVRLPAAISKNIDAIAAQQNRKPSEVMREAIINYVNTALPESTRH